jgi:hypothetical protein
VLVDTEDEDALAQLALHAGKAALAQVAVAGVVGAPLGVVEVGDDRGVEARLGQQIQAREPVGVLAHLVDLIDRHRGRAQGQRRRAGEGDAPAGAQFLPKLGGEP